MKNLLLLVTPLFVLAGLSCRKEVTTSPEEVFIPKFSLLVDSKPQGSKILINNRYMGQTTPDTIKWLEEGNHLVTLKSDIFKDSSILVNIEDKFNSVYFDYTTNPTMLGHLYFTSNPPGADIYLNDSNTTLKTPAKIEDLFPVNYDVTYKLPGYWDGHTNVKVVSARTITVEKFLVDTLYWVHFTSGTAGLPTDWFNDLAIQDGYIKWFASEGEGLLRFDDKEWKIYNTSNSSIPSNNVRSVKTAENGIWIGTDNGAALLSNENFTVYNSSNSSLSDDIKVIAPAPGGKAWAGTPENGIFYFDGVNWIHYHKDNVPLYTNKINTLLVDKNNILWIGTLGEGLILYDGVRWLRILNALRDTSPNVEAISVSDYEIVLGCSFHTRMAWNGMKFLTKLFNGGISIKTDHWTAYKQAGRNIVALAKSADGSIWFSDFTTGLGKKTAEGWQRYYINKINGIAIDGAGNKWMTRSENGIVKYKGD